MSEYSSRTSTANENTTDSMAKRGYLTVSDEIVDLPEGKTVSSIAVISGSVTITGIQDVTDKKLRLAGYLPNMNREFAEGVILPINLRDVNCDATGADVFLFWGRSVPQNEIDAQDNNQPQP